MKTEEDEAFDDLAKKQGDWGGGFPAKRQAAMDKINSDFDEEYKKMHEDRIKYGTSWSQDGKRIDPMSVYKEQPAQEPVAFLDWYENAIWGNEDFQDGCHRAWDAALEHTPPQRKPLTDEQAKKLLWIGPVHAPNGVISRDPLSYRKELLAERLHGLRLGEAAHGIKENT